MHVLVRKPGVMKLSDREKPVLRASHSDAKTPTLLFVAWRAIWRSHASNMIVGGTMSCGAGHG
jgi:hypothetical protein